MDLQRRYICPSPTQVFLCVLYFLPGNTCCQDDDILNEVSDHSVRIDQIFVRNLELPVSVLTHTVGDKPSDRLPSGLWPSDHAGVVVYLAVE